VDALSALVLVMLFTFMIFIVIQFSLTTHVRTRDEQLASLERVIATLKKSLETVTTHRNTVQRDAQQLARDHAALHDTLAAEREKLGDAQQTQTSLRSDVVSLTQAIQGLEAEIRRLAANLTACEDTLQLKEAHVVTLEETLAKLRQQQAQELSGYRSEFFGNIKKVLGKRTDMRVVGDRFIFQSEVLFSLGSDKIGESGRATLRQIANALKEIAGKMPPQTKWILRVDGHTDVLPFKNQVGSNWELSMARALAVVRVFLEEGVPPQHLAPAGFAEFHPLDPQDLSRNRRIELKLDQR
jgi:chemotaxis protein MotB